MAKPEWGTKRLCQGCGAKYYDMRAQPIVCPKCGANFDADTLLRSRRVRNAGKPEEPVAKPSPAKARKAEEKSAKDEEEEKEEKEQKEEKEEEAAEDEDVEAEDDSDDEDDEDVIEDASELGEDDDDMAEVVVEDDDDDNS